MTRIHSVTAVLLKANSSVICQNCQALTRTFHFNACFNASLSFIKHSWENIDMAIKFYFFLYSNLIVVTLNSSASMLNVNVCVLSASPQ